MYYTGRYALGGIHFYRHLVRNNNNPPFFVQLRRFRFQHLSDFRQFLTNCFLGLYFDRVSPEATDDCRRNPSVPFKCTRFYRTPALSESLCRLPTVRRIPSSRVGRRRNVVPAEKPAPTTNSDRGSGSNLGLRPSDTLVFERSFYFLLEKSDTNSCPALLAGG